jgi:hypothetical protein
MAPLLLILGILTNAAARMIVTRSLRRTRANAGGRRQVERRFVFQCRMVRLSLRAIPRLRRGGPERECDALSAAVRFRPARDELSRRIASA